MEYEGFGKNMGPFLNHILMSVVDVVRMIAIQECVYLYMFFKVD